MSKILHEIFDIDDENIAKEPQEVAVIEASPISIGGAAPPPEDDAEDIKLQQDFNEAVSNIKDAIEIAKEAVEKVAAIASDTEDDKDFNALNNLLKTIVDSSEKTIGLYAKKIEYKERKRKILAPVNAGGDGARFSINNAVFTGTLDQLHTAIDDANEKGDN